MVTLNHPASDSSNWYQAVTNNWNAIETNLLDQNIAMAKGDLVVAPSASAFSKLGVGTDGQVLMADSTQPLGMKWNTVHTSGLVAVSTVRATTSDTVTTTSFVTMNSMTLTLSVTSPQKVLVYFCASFEGAGLRFALMQLLRGTTVIASTTVAGQGGTNGFPGSLFSLDQPGTGSFTYSVQWKINSASWSVTQVLQPFSANGDRQLTGIILPG